MNEGAYRVILDNCELSITRRHDRQSLTVCFQRCNHAVESALDALKYVHDFVRQAIDDDEKFSLTVRGSQLRERDSKAEIFELKKLVEIVNEVLQVEGKLMDGGEADDEDAAVKLRKARKAILEAAKRTVRNACHARNFDREATDRVMYRVFVDGSSLSAAIEGELSQQQQRNNEGGLVR